MDIVLGSWKSVFEYRQNSLGRSSGEHDLWHLQRRLDFESDVLSTRQHPDAWRARFRLREMNFSIPKACTHRHREKLSGRSSFASAAFSATGRFLVILTRDSMRTSTATRLPNFVVLYQITNLGDPLYVGWSQCPTSEEKLNILQVIETRMNTSWILRLSIGSTKVSYKITTVRNYAMSDAPFALSVAGNEGSEIEIGLSAEFSHKLLRQFQTVNKHWDVLDYLPDLSVSLISLLHPALVQNSTIE